MPLEEGNLLNERYRITEILGKGGMGHVYKAVDESLSVDVAVKENLIGDEEASRQFRREATILASLRHANLPRVTDHFIIPDQGQYLVMDFVSGEDLKQRLDRSGALDEKEVMLIGVAICEALNYLHTLDQPVIHRDIKPGNIKITPRGQVYLVDFGLVKVVEGSQETTTGARGLTPGYSPPEQYGSARTDARSDIYSLGATLYTVLTGSPPADGLAIMMGQDELVPIRKKNGKVNQKLAATIEKAINVKPEDRIQTAAAFKQALLESSDTVQREVAQGTIRLQPAPPKPTDATVRADSIDDLPPIPDSQERSAKFKLTRWMIAGVIGLCGLLFIGAGLTFGRTALQQFIPAVAADQSTATAIQPTLAPTKEVVDTGQLEELPPTTVTATEAPVAPVETPTGGSAQIAFASMRDGHPQIYLMDLLTKEITQITDINGGACQPDWSPDGKQLVFISPCNNDKDRYDNASLFIMDADGSNRNPLDLTGEGGYDPNWSPDGSKIAFTSLRTGRVPNVYVIDVETRDVTNLSMKNARDFQPNWSPDSELIAFTTVRSGPNEIWTMNPKGGELQVFSRVPQGDCVDSLWSPDMDDIIFTQYAGSDRRGLIISAPWLGGAKERGFNQHTVIDLSATTKEPDFSPDGFWMVFVSTQDPGNLDIFLMRNNGSELQRLTTDETRDFDPAWRPGIPLQ